MHDAVWNEKYKKLHRAGDGDFDDMVERTLCSNQSMRAISIGGLEGKFERCWLAIGSMGTMSTNNTHLGIIWKTRLFEFNNWFGFTKNIPDLCGVIAYHGCSLQEPQPPH